MHDCQSSLRVETIDQSEASLRFVAYMIYLTRCMKSNARYRCIYIAVHVDVFQSLEVKLALVLQAGSGSDTGTQSWRSFSPFVSVLTVSGY